MSLIRPDTGLFVWTFAVATVLAIAIVIVGLVIYNSTQKK